MLWFIFLLICLIALSQTPLLVDLLRLLFPQWRIKRLTDKLSVYLLRILMTTFFITGLGQHMFVFIPLMPNVPFRSVKLLFHCVFAYWVWFNMTINYYLATFLCPGYCADSAVPSEESSSSLPSISKSDTGSGDIQRSSFPSIRTERTSSGLSNTTNDNREQSRHKLASTEDHRVGATTCVPTFNNRHHYCTVCCKTVLYMDHHCPFTGNCVGYYNYSHFFLFLVYAWMGLDYAIATSLFYFGECFFPLTWGHLGFIYLSKESDVCSVLEPYGDYLIPVVGGFIVLTLLLGFQLFLLLSDMTTYDVLKNFWKQPVFKLGLERVRQGRYKRKESRLHRLLLQQRHSMLSFVLPINNNWFNIVQ